MDIDIIESTIFIYILFMAIDSMFPPSSFVYIHVLICVCVLLRNIQGMFGSVSLGQSI